jgi:ABC-2 type transport system permease protein
VLFGPLLKGLPTASLGSGGNAYRFFVPGLLIQLGLFRLDVRGLRHHL